jgi:hypothetical protein
LVEYSKNKFTRELMDGHVQDDNFRIMDDIIYYKSRIFLVPKSTFKSKVLQACHDSPVARHQRVHQNIQADKGKICLERLEGRCDVPYQGMHHLSGKQG